MAGPKKEATLVLRIKRVGKGVFSSVISGIESVTSYAKWAVAGLSALGVAGVAAAKQLGAFNGVQRSFRALADSQGQDSRKMLANMRQLSQGMVSDLKLMEQANTALLLGLPVDRFGDMLKIAQSSAAATGQSMEFMLNSIVTGLGRGSKLMLDNLGIVFKAEDANRDYAKAMGIVGRELTEAEKKQAFINKALSVGIANTEKAGGSALTLSQRIDKLSASFQNKFMVALQASQPALEIFVQGIENMFGSIEGATSYNNLSNFFETATKSSIIAKTFFTDLGKISANIVTGIARHFRLLFTGQFTKLLENATTTFKDNYNIMKTHGERVSKELNEVEDQFANARVERTRQEMEQKRAIRQEAVETEKQVEQENWDEKMAQEMERRQLEIDAIGASDAQKLALKQKALDLELKAEKDAAKRKAIWEEKLEVQKKQKQLALDKEEEKRQELMMQGYGQFLSGMAALAQSGNKRVAAIGKAAAIAKATMDAYVAINTTLASLPFPANVAAAAGIGVQAFANVAQIAGVKFAEGGIVPATQGGMSAIIGEAGRSEAVIPLPDDFDPDDGAPGFGGGMVINFTGPVLGDAEQARSFAIMLDEELYKLRKGNESLSFDEGIV